MKRRTVVDNSTLKSTERLLVDTSELMELTCSGRRTATVIGKAAGAETRVGRRVMWNVDKIRKYLSDVAC